MKKPLIAVKRITEKGNKVCFGPETEDNYIINEKVGHKVPLRPSGTGSYLMDVSLDSGQKTVITVDSGTEENVCPWEWGQEYGTFAPLKMIKFNGADGSPIAHWGRRPVRVTSPF